MVLQRSSASRLAALPGLDVSVELIGAGAAKFDLSFSMQETAAGLVKTRLHCDHAELSIFDFAMGSHHPDKVDRISRH